MNNLLTKKSVWLIIAVCFILLLNCFQIKAKDDCNEKNLLIKYDYLNLEKPLSGGGNGDCYVVLFRGNVTFQVINVNPFLYRVRINSILKDYFLESPKIYQEAAKEAMEMKKSKMEQAESADIKLVLESKQEKTFDEAKKKLDKTLQAALDSSQEDMENKKTINDEKSNAANEAAKKAEEAESLLKEAKDKIETAKDKLEKAKAANEDVTTFETDIKTTENAYESRSKAANEAKEDAKRKEEERKKAQSDYIISKSLYDEKLIGQMEPVKKFGDILDFIDAFKKMDIILDFYYQLVEVSFRIGSFENIKNNLNILIFDTKKKFPDVRNIVPDFRQWIKFAIEKYNNIDFFWLNDQKNNALTPEQIEQLKTCKDNIDTIKDLNIIGKIQTILTNITEENFTRSVTIPNVESDEIQFKAEIEPLPNAGDVDVLQQLRGPVIVRTKRGWIINFSTGVLFHFNAHDRTYRIEEAPTQDTGNPKYNIRENENKTSITHGVVALMHIYPRSISSIRWGGISFGLGTEDTKRINYYFGTGCMFGSLGRFVVNIGVVLTEIDYLKPGYKKDVEVNLPDKVTAENLVEKQLKPRVFFGFTYNLNN